MSKNCAYLNKQIIAFLLIFLSQVCAGQTDTNLAGTRAFHRAYSLVYGLRHDVLNSSENIRTGLKLYSDVYYRVLSPKIENKTFRNIAGFVWSFAGKWSSMLWPHEFGHMLRTNQVGGKFSFVKFQFPGVLGKLDLPNEATPEHHTLALIGGFEANYLITRDIQLDFFRYGGLYNDELGIAFGNRIIYALYTYAFFPQNPNKPETWELEGGDPVNFVKLVWEKGGREVFNVDGSVNDQLIRFYNNAGLYSILWNLLDLSLYKQAGAFFGDELEGEKPLYWGNEKFAWSYGTFFNASVLGAELYFNNYLRTGTRFYNVYFKYGFPFKNYGIGILMPDLLTAEKFNVLGQVDLWSQDYYGNGIAIGTTAQFKVANRVNILTQLGYKSKGYLVGRTTEKGVFGHVGLNYSFNK